MSPELHSFPYGTRELAFQLSYSKRRRRTVGITILPDSSIQVTAPTETPLEQVLTAVGRRASWIVRQLQFFATVPAPLPAREYVGGETHRYTGRQYRLRIHEAASNDSESVKLRGAYIEVHTRQPQARAHTRQLVEQWYLQHARKRLAERYQYCSDQVRRYGITAPDCQLRTMPTRWGSYTRSGRILLNPRLIQAPTACIDYLILHELCHVAHPHHGPSFYQLLTRLLPNWQKLRERLNQLV